MTTPNKCNKGSCLFSENNQKISAQSPESSTLSDNDIWASSDDETHNHLNYDGSQQQHHSQEKSSQDIAALQRRHENRGYYDGLVKGKDEGLQTGFDLGYPIGAQLGGLIGGLIAETLWKYNNKQLSDTKKNEILDELKIGKILSSDYFDEDLAIECPQNHPVIQKWTTFLQND